MQNEKRHAETQTSLVMVDEETGEKYAPAAGRKEGGPVRELDWLIKNMLMELRCRRHPG